MKRARIVLVISLGLYAIATIAPDVVHCFLPKNTFGYIGTKYSGAVVTAVEPGSAAAAAGIRPGDRIELRSLSLHDRLFIGTARTLIPEMTDSATGTVPYVGQRVTLHVIHSGRMRVVTLTARAHDPTNSDIFWELWGFACHAMRVVLGVALVLARPGLVTWAFYAYMLGLGFFGSSDYYNSLPAPLWIAVMIPQYVISGVAPASQALLWLVFPAGILTAWRKRALFVVIAGFGVGAGLALAEMSSAIFAFDTANLERAWNVFDVGIGLLGMIALAATVVTSRGFERRLTAVLFAITLLAFSAEATIVAFNLLGLPPLRIFQYVFLLGVLLPLFIAYSIVRYQMFDVEYVLSRTVVYAMLAIVVVGVFIGVDAVFASYFHGSRGELALDIAIALALGFALQAFHKRVVDLVDRIFFTRRYDARIKLKSVLNSIAHSDSKETIEGALTSNAGASLGLASAVFFERLEDGGYLRRCGYGWSGAALWNILPDDALAQCLRTTKGSVDLRTLGWARTGQAPPNAPALAVPMRSGEAIFGLTLYGDRRDGILLSPDELHALIDLSDSSSSAYAFFVKISPPGIVTIASARAAL